jgi:hypothetical protein
MTSFAILRTKKYKSLQSIAGVSKHHTREIPCKTADIKKAPQNKFWGAGASSNDVRNKVKTIIAEAQEKAPRKFRDNTVKAIEYVMTASPEWWKTASRDERNGYLKKCRSWLEEKHGRGCIAAEWLHMDEASPHLHAIVVPLFEGVLNAKHFLGGKKVCSELQTDFHKQCGEPYGLERGIIKSNAKHMRAVDWWAALNAPTPKPTKLDFAKAAMGVDVPAVAVALQQAQALKAFQTAESNVKGRVAAIRLRERELAVQESFLGDKLKLSMRVSELERENATLKSKVRTLETPQPGTYVPGQGVSPR